MANVNSEQLRVEEIQTFYGKSHILQGVSLHIEQGECVSLLGRNGAGKSTTLRSIIGLNPPRDGQILFKGQRIDGKKPYDINQHGIGYVPEDRQIFSTLNVEENLNLAVRKRPEHRRWNLESVYRAFHSLAERRRNKGNQLSGGEQQMLTIARALMGNPELLLLDEPTQGLAPLAVEALLDTIQNLRKDGLTILLVEQNVEATRGIASRYYILQQGRVVYESDHQDFWSRPELKEKYLGV